MNILFLCTAHNSLSQLLFLTLSVEHDVTIEYALSEEVMITAAELAKPDLIVCPFLTVKVPQEIYKRYMTLIIHPGPPGDSGPSSLDWMLMGDDGSIPDTEALLAAFDQGYCPRGRTFWAVTILQAIEVFDSGPVWAFEQFPINIDQPGLTKSTLYRTQITQAAVRATKIAIERIVDAACCQPPVRSHDPEESRKEYHIHANLTVDPMYGILCTGAYKPFLGGNTGHRPLLKPANRGFDINRHPAQFISRHMRCGDSQPGALTSVLGPKVYVYGGIVEEHVHAQNVLHGAIFAVRHEAVCIGTCDGKGVWITHLRRLKKKTDVALWPKVSAVSGLMDLGVLTHDSIQRLNWKLPDPWNLATKSTFQEIWVDIVRCRNKRVAYVYFNFYNGAMSTPQCRHLLECLNHILSVSTLENPISALVLMGGAYFSNGIALNVIEASSNQSLEGWKNINAIDDIVHSILHKFASRNIMTIGAIRGNAAAGGVALAAACDFVIAAENVVLNPSYRAIGLYGSEYHTLTYYGRCGEDGAKDILMDMMPISAEHANEIGLVDYVVDGTGKDLDRAVMALVERLLEEIEEPALLPNKQTNQETDYITEIEISDVNIPRVTQYDSHPVNEAQWLCSRNGNENDGENPQSGGNEKKQALGLIKPLEVMPPIKSSQVQSPFLVSRSKIEESGFTSKSRVPVLKSWKARLQPHVVLDIQTLSQTRTTELGEMALDFWSPRSARFHQRRFNFVRKVPAQQTPLRFAKHRRRSSSGTGPDPSKESICQTSLNEEERPEWDSITHWEARSRLHIQDDVFNELHVFLDHLSPKEHSTEENELGAPQKAIPNAPLKAVSKRKRDEVVVTDAIGTMQETISFVRTERPERTEKQEILQLPSTAEIGVLFPCYYNEASAGIVGH